MFNLNNSFSQNLNFYNKQSYKYVTIMHDKKVNSKDDGMNQRFLTSYDKLALAYIYIKNKKLQKNLEYLCSKHNTFNTIPISELEEILKIKKKINYKFIKTNVLPTLLENNEFMKILTSKNFKPQPDKNLYTIENSGVVNKNYEYRPKIQFNFKIHDYKLLAISFESIFSAIEKHIEKILIKENAKNKFFSDEHLDILSKQLKEISQDEQKQINVSRLLMRYSGNEYKTWNALARGMTSLKGHTLDIIAKTSTRNIDDFLLNLYYLNDINSALRKGRVDLNFSHLKNSNNDVYLYRGINICGAASWFNITIPKKANCTIQEIRKTFATELTKKINSTHGLEVIDTAPMSTSYSEDVAKIFSQDSTYSNNAIVMKIKAPGNRLKGIDMSLYSIHQDEEEILLPAGVKLKITKCEYDEKNNDAVVVYAEIINEWNDLNTNQK